MENTNNNGTEIKYREVTLAKYMAVIATNSYCHWTQERTAVKVWAWVFSRFSQIKDISFLVWNAEHGYHEEKPLADFQKIVLEEIEQNITDFKASK